MSAVLKPGAEDRADAGEIKAAPAFISACAQDVNTFNETGDTMSAVPETVSNEVRAPLTVELHGLSKFVTGHSSFTVRHWPARHADIV